MDFFCWFFFLLVVQSDKQETKLSGFKEMILVFFFLAVLVLCSFVHNLLTTIGQIISLLCIVICSKLNIDQMCWFNSINLL